MIGLGFGEKRCKYYCDFYGEHREFRRSEGNFGYDMGYLGTMHVRLHSGRTTDFIIVLLLLYYYIGLCNDKLWTKMNVSPQ